MINNKIFNVDLGKFLAENRPQSNFYKPIKRTGDLITASRISQQGSNGNRLPELFIAPPNVKLGSLPARVLNELEQKLILTAAPTPEEIVRLPISDLIDIYGGGDPNVRNVMRVTLEQAGLTGKIIAAAKKLNESRLNPVDRAILSKPNIAMYTFYRAAVGLSVKDVDGIVSNVLSSISKVKTFVNRELVIRVIDQQNLESTTAEKTILQNRLANREISYLNEDATRAILEEYSNIKDRGELIEAVNEFLDSGLIMVPDHIDRNGLVNKMIAYLAENGFNPDVIIGLDADFSVSVAENVATFTDESVDDVAITDWFWDFGDGNTSDEQSPTHEYAAAGNYDVTLEITDEDGNWDEKTQTIMVSEAPAPTPPVADFNFEASGLEVAFKDESTSDSPLAGWEWRFGDNSTSEAQNTSHAYGTAGTYKVELKVTNDAGATDSISKDVEVRDDRFDSLVQGIVLAPDGSLAAGVRVRAVDDNPNTPPDLLGQEVRTNSSGAYKIYYHRSNAIPEGGHERGGPDIIIEVLDENGDVLIASDRQRDAAQFVNMPFIQIPSARPARKQTSRQKPKKQ